MATLSETYFYLKLILTEKYCKALEVVEKAGERTPNSENFSMMHVKIDNYNYNSAWKTDIGEICFFIEHNVAFSSIIIKLVCYDIISGAVVRRHALNNL